ncbi:MAG: SprT-like domain-containing protein [Candidatus Peribacteraceae bacterium]|nr:SprT-like domain-containing protein [Candidatus Peribacteraceae bacterium]
MNLATTATLARQLLGHYGLSGWNFRFDRARRRFGCCNFATKTISLSKVLAELNSPAKVRDTLLHEIAHALVGPRHNHDSIWKDKIAEIGGKPKARFRETEVVIPKSKFAAVCPNCQREFPVFRRSTKKVACRDCCRRFNKGRFSREFILRFSEN